MSLPSGYTQIEYIESTGTQYIDTGVIINKSDSANLEMLTHLISNDNYAGCNGYMQFQAKIGNGAKSNIVINYSNTTEVIYVNGSIVTTTDWSGYGGVNVKLGLFKLGDANDSWYSSSPQLGKLYFCTIKKNEVVVKKFIPCISATNVVGLWDDVSGQFYTNAGTGAFIAGPETNPNLTAHKTLINGTIYDVQGGKCRVNGTGYDIKKGRTLVGGTGYDITFAPSYDPVFANNTWEQIIEACHNNEVPDTWKVADQKPMTINGADYQIDIIGKNHDDYSDGSGKAPLTFQMHDCYRENKSMNRTETSAGGWGSCDMRLKHLPAILSLMPAEVQSGIREVNKLTSADNQSDNIVTEQDKLFLLSEIEIFGIVRYSKSDEGTQYDYYKAGNSKVKKFKGTTRYWWERSPRSKNYGYFCCVDRAGHASYSYVTADDGVAFAFCF